MTPNEEEEAPEPVKSQATENAALASKFLELKEPEPNIRSLQSQSLARP